MITLRDYQIEAIEDLRHKFKAGYKKLGLVLPCGTGKTIIFAFMAKKHLEQNSTNRVLFLVHRRELVEQAEETFKKLGIQSERLHIAMAQTITRHLEKEPYPTLIVADEVHHYVSGTFKKILDYFSNANFVGLTATPVRLDGRPLLYSIFEYLYIGQSSDWFINKGWLSKYDYYAPKINLADADWKPKGSDFDMNDATDKLDKANIYGDVLKYLDLNRKTIIYSPSVAFSKKITNEINEHYKKPVASHFDGDTPKLERKRIMDMFRNGEIRVLCNCELIGEGVDVPDCDCVMLLRPTKSLALYIQQSMRCLRPYPNKRAVIYDFVGNVWRHGLPTMEHKWALNKPMKSHNKSEVEGVMCRQCQNCFMVYEGKDPVCPYCGFNNGKTKQELEEEKEAELMRVKAIEKDERKKAWNFEQLVQLGKKRGYKNPVYWAQCVMKGRNKHV